MSEAANLIAVRVFTVTRHHIRGVIYYVVKQNIKGKPRASLPLCCRKRGNLPLSVRHMQLSSGEARS